MSDQLTLPGMTSAISLPGLPAGATPCASPVGQTTGPCGPEAAPASRSVARGSSLAQPTLVIFGQPSPISSASAALCVSLGNRLRARLERVGSMEYGQTWKWRATPAGLRYLAHTASARRTSGNGCTGWPSPQVHDVTTRGNTEADCHHYPHDLSNAAMAAGWVSPKSRDYHASHKPGYAGDYRTDLASQAKELAGWPTPNAMEGGQTSRGGERRGEKLMGGLAPWPTPSARDWKGCKSNQHGVNARPLNEVADLGLTPSGSPAGTEKRGALGRESCLLLDGWQSPTAADSTNTYQSPNALAKGWKPRLNEQAHATPQELRGSLNPALPRWLMGFPVEWCQAAVAASRKLKTPQKRG